MSPKSERGMSQLTRIVVTDGDVEDMVASGMVAAENAVRQTLSAVR